MANEVYTRTNQALHFARWSLASWHQAAESGALDAVTQARYHREHVVFHLYRAVLAVIHEVADRYRWPLLDVRTVEQVLDGRVAERYPGPELAELNELALHKETWLAGLLAAWQQLQAPPKPQESKPRADEQIIASSALEPAKEWGLAQAEEALAALNERVSCYRDGMQEW